MKRLIKGLFNYSFILIGIGIYLYLHSKGILIDETHRHIYLMGAGLFCFYGFISGTLEITGDEK